MANSAPTPPTNLTLTLWPTPAIDHAWIQAFYRDSLHALLDDPPGCAPGPSCLDCPPSESKESSVPYQSDSTLKRWSSPPLTYTETHETEYVEAGSSGTRSRQVSRFEFDIHCAGHYAGHHAGHHAGARAAGAPEHRLTFISDRDWMQADRTRTLTVTGSIPDLARMTLERMLPAQFSVDWTNLQDGLANEIDRLALGWMRSGDWKSILATLTQIPEPARSPTVALAIGAAHGATGDFEKAESTLAAAVDRHPAHELTGDLLYNLALALERLGRAGDAIARISEARARSQKQPAGSENPVYLFLLAKLLVEHAPARLPEARELLQQAIAASPNPGGHFGFRGMDVTKDAQALLAKISKS